MSHTQPSTLHWTIARIAVAFLLGWLLAAWAAAQELAEERRRVLTVAGSVNSVNLPLQPLNDTLGLVFVREVNEPLALGLRLRFTIEGEAPADGSWGIQVKDATGRPVWSTWAGAVGNTGFWSDEINGQAAKVEVYSTRRANPVRLRIDKIAVRKDKITPLSITGKNDLLSIVGQDSWIVDRGRSVARLRFVGDDGGYYVCTAFLVTTDLMLTNQHCIASSTELDSALVDFDFDTDNSMPATFRLRELLQTDVALDYALVRLEKPISRPPLRLDSSLPPDGEQLLIIQHPGGEPKQVSIRDCKVDGTSVQGRVGLGTDFGHQCDTKGGSSGSPVFRFDTKTVVGLHHLGFDAASQRLINRAVHITRVIADLSPDFRAEVTAGQQAP